MRGTGRSEDLAGGGRPAGPTGRDAGDRPVGHGDWRAAAGEPATAGLPQLERQVVERDGRSVGQHDGPLEHVLELADVAGPVVGHQGLDRLRVDVGDQLAGPLRVEVQEVDRQLEDVLRALAQGRHVQADHVEPVVQVFAKPPGSDQGLEVLMGRGQDPDVDRDRLRAADALERHLLQDAEQLGLDFEVDVADLVEEERAAVGLLEPTDAVAVCTGEGTLDVAEELAFQQALGQGGAQWSLTNGRAARGLA